MLQRVITKFTRADKRVMDLEKYFKEHEKILKEGLQKVEEERRRAGRSDEKDVG